MANHLRFVGRTVMVQNGNVEAAYGVLNSSASRRSPGCGCQWSERKEWLSTETGEGSAVPRGAACSAHTFAGPTEVGGIPSPPRSPHGWIARRTS
ncbi:small ribosomal subunit protein bS21m isoform X1 [Hirundo rustica]|uniref:small ribosomal subunit protein bS21m isoform X1 n=1 Tax=Hirundo rustica TaxID=43150 RepID=UPI001A94B695|nr:small ribosomal subunit protein bS21m isoform X1 [Hirundo rustica]